MKERGPYRIPSISALIAFESAARNGSFTGAAGELRTSQSALSRRIAALEEQLSTRLFERSRSGVTLTPAGYRFRDAVVAGLGVIQAGAVEAASGPTSDYVVIACSHDVSQLVVFPLYDALRDQLGEEVGVSVSTHRNDFHDRPVDADLVLSWQAENVVPDAAPEDMATVFREEVQLICSSDFAARHADVLSAPVAGWGGLTFLDMELSSPAWTSWSDWFEATGSPERPPRFEFLQSYIQVLEAATAGRGIALGWRHYIERYVDTGAVIMLSEAFVEFDNRLVAALTAKGRGNPNARECLSFFGRLV